MKSIFTETMVLNNWQEIEDYAKREAIVLFPLGVIEEHGPHISLGSDINWSHTICVKVKEKLYSLGCESIIAPPYYWGVNHCTSGFAGSFSLSPGTMSQVIFEILGNLNNFGFNKIFCFNYHGDSLHIDSIIEAIKRANSELNISARLVLEAMELKLHCWTGNEGFLTAFNPPYPLEWFEEADPREQDLLDIHAGAFETAVMKYFCPEQVNADMALKLSSSSLDGNGLEKWLRGGSSAREAVPLGYAGNPSGYKAVEKHINELVELQVKSICEKIINDIR